jgi:hypothetical protein
VKSEHVSVSFKIKKGEKNLLKLLQDKRKSDILKKTAINLERQKK